MTRLEKLKAAQEVLESWRSDIAKNGPNLASYLANEIAQLEDPFLPAKHLLHAWQRSTTTTPGAGNLVDYVDHLKNELAKAKAAEPLDPKRVMATAAYIVDDIKQTSDTRREILRDTLMWLSGSGAAEKYEFKPYEVQE